LHVFGPIKEFRAVTPQFDSAELNYLLRLEMAEGAYASPEDALMAGLRVLRERREFESQLSDRLASFADGRSIELVGDDALGEFLDAIDEEVDSELRSATERGA
jgi:hypothetical protein